MSTNIKPEHYQGDNGDLLSSMSGFMTEDEIRGFYKGNIIKYTTRYNKKNGLEDLTKASYYIERCKEWEQSLLEESEDMINLVDTETQREVIVPLEDFLNSQLDVEDFVKKQLKVETKPIPFYQAPHFTNDILKASNQFSKAFDDVLNESLDRMAKTTKIRGLK